jgi:hypothetical protein
LSCATATDGEITVTATGGTGTITILKTTEQLKLQMYSAVLPPTHQIKVKDANS